MMPFDMEGAGQLNVRLYSACFHGHLNEVKLLIDQGADPNYATAMGQGKSMCMKAAEENKHTEIVAYLINYRRKEKLRAL